LAEAVVAVAGRVGAELGVVIWQAAVVVEQEQEPWPRE
jgi:hypothetical protein